MPCDKISEVIVGGDIVYKQADNVSKWEKDMEIDFINDFMGAIRVLIEVVLPATSSRT